ncbi:MAG TPA: hypothetical protein VEA40_27340, partial [Ramlibacter sp.]|nr:hypothetical protein [Ramlibacter sp.]
MWGEKAAGLRRRYLRPLQWKLRERRGLPAREELEQRYWAAVEPVLEKHGNLFTRDDAEAFLEPWIETVAFSRGPLRDAWPWMAFPAIRHLEALLDKSSKVFEYGAGGSSMFFASRVGELVSVEHDAGWFAKTHRAMKRARRAHGVRWHGVLGEPREPDQ